LQRRRRRRARRSLKQEDTTNLWVELSLSSEGRVGGERERGNPSYCFWGVTSAKALSLFTCFHILAEESRTILHHSRVYFVPVLPSALSLFGGTFDHRS